VTRCSSLPLLFACGQSRVDGDAIFEHDIEAGAYERDTCHKCGAASDDCEQVGERTYCPDHAQAADARRCEIAAVEECGLEFSDDEIKRIYSSATEYAADLRQTVLDYVDALNAANLATKVRS
jgi:methionyl-tRNA synthetase